MICANCERRVEAGEEVVVILHALATDEGDSVKNESVEWVCAGRCWGAAAIACYLETFSPILGEIVAALAEEIDLLVEAANEERHCPKCEEPLDGQFLYIEGLYTGVRLSCPGCGFMEY
ncbi:MAG: hypothetical protein ACE5LU_22670 [Anaerolineae bacterium]